MVGGIRIIIEGTTTIVGVVAHIVVVVITMMDTIGVEDTCNIADSWSEIVRNSARYVIAIEMPSSLVMQE